MRVRNDMIEIVVRLDLREDLDEIPERTPPSILMAKGGACVAGWGMTFPVQFPSWEALSYFFDGVQLDNYEAKESGIKILNFASTVPGPLW